MNNKSVSDFVAATMNAVLESDEHKALFGTFQKNAFNKTAKTHKEIDPSSNCDSAAMMRSETYGQCMVGHPIHLDKGKADDNAAKDSSKGSSPADDNDAKDGSSDKVSSAFDIAIDGLLTASAALDSVGFEKSASLSLRIASFVAEAKKKSDKKSDKKSGKKDEKSSGKSPAKGDSNSAKDKKSDKSSSKSTSTPSSSKKPVPKKDEKKSKK